MKYMYNETCIKQTVMGQLIAFVAERLKYFLSITDININVMKKHCIFMEKN